MNVVVLGTIHPSGLALLRTAADVRVFQVDPADRTAVADHVVDADAILIRTSPLNADLIERAGRLKVVSRYGVGVDNIDVAALTRRGIPVAIVGDDNATSVAEHTLYLMLAATKMGIAYDRSVRSGNWSYRDSGAAIELEGKRVFIVGLGKIGQRVARLCEAFGMAVSFYDPRTNVEAAAGWARATDLPSGLALADVVTVHTPLTPATRSLIGAMEFAAMRRSAVLVSTSRGGVVDEKALVHALSNRIIRAAGMDVFEIEPIELGNPLIGLDNVVLSPHMAALSDESAERMALTAARNCLEGMDGRLDPARVVNPAVLVRVGEIHRARG